MALNDFIVLIYESGICLAVLFSMYWLFLKRETYFRFNRFYLLSIMAVAFALPLINLGIFENSGELSTLRGFSSLSETITLPAVTIINESESLSPSSYNWKKFALLIYLLGVSLLLTRAVLGILRIEMMKRNGRKIICEGYSIVYTQQAISPFSFFRTIYLNDVLADEPDSTYIINHEVIHIKQGHTYDNLFLEIFLVVFWFNPFMWFLKGALRENHEYLADNGVLNQKANPTTYQKLLLRQIVGLSPITLASTFNSTIKNRIIMMCKNKSSVFAKFKPLLLVPTLTCLTLLFACNENPKDFKADNNLKESVQEDMELTDPIVEEIDLDSVKELLVEDREIFYIVQDMPTFNGGDPRIEFPKYIAQNLRYPESAKADNIGGLVEIQFVINKEGTVVDAKVIESVSPVLDEEAIRVVMSSPKWTPGKQMGKVVEVIQKFPINFVTN